MREGAGGRNRRFRDGPGREHSLAGGENGVEGHRRRGYLSVCRCWWFGAENLLLLRPRLLLLRENVLVPRLALLFARADGPAAHEEYNCRCKGDEKRGNDEADDYARDAMRLLQTG